VSAELLTVQVAMKNQRFYVSKTTDIESSANANKDRPRFRA